MAGLSEKLRQSKRPPDLRRGNAKQRCQLCVHFRPTQGKCALYDYPVRPTQLCDSFKAAGGGGKGQR
jgi:hypothetical protein